MLTATAWPETCAGGRTLTTVSASLIPVSTFATPVWEPMRAGAPLTHSAATLARDVTTITFSRSALSPCLRPAPCPMGSAALPPLVQCGPRALPRPQLQVAPRLRRQDLSRALRRSVSMEATAWQTATVSPATSAAFRARFTVNVSLTQASFVRTVLAWPTTAPSARTRLCAAILEPSVEEDPIGSVLNLQHPIALFPPDTSRSFPRQERRLWRQLLSSRSTHLQRLRSVRPRRPQLSHLLLVMSAKYLSNQ